MASRREAKDRAKREAAATPAEPAPEGFLGEGEPAAHQWGEALRRTALSLLAALIAARAYFPGEDAEQGSGSGWLLILLLTLVLAVVAAWLGGAVRLRWSWADAAVAGLIALIVLSVSQGAERRAALTMGWEWIGLGLAYLLLRCLPRNRDEASALAGILLATACAVSAAGFYQRLVEDPASRELYRRNPELALRLAEVPNDPSSRSRYEDRLIHSTEPRGTFALANSLAGFLVGPAVFGLAAAAALALSGRRQPGSSVDEPIDRSPAPALLLAAVPLLGLVVCLVLTKSRSAYLGLVTGLAAAVLVQARGRGGRRWIGVTLGLAALVGAIGLASAWVGVLDRRVLTESTKSLRYRVEYWQGAWGVITESPRRFWSGVGPGNFAGAYLRHKVPSASEEIRDPHNLVLEVWAASGMLAALALLAALGLALVAAFAPGRSSGAAQPARAPERTGWLWAVAGLGGWALVALLGHADLSEPGRWIVIGLGWTAAALLLQPLWRRRPAGAAELGAAVLAIAGNLLAAGGIAFPPVALALWTSAALAQDLRVDRPCGRLRLVGGRWLAFGGMLGVSALLGSFLGTMGPAWNAEAALNEGRAALARRGGPDFDAAREAFHRASEADPLDPRPWLESAALELRAWESQGAWAGSRVWLTISALLDEAARPPRNPHSLRVQGLRLAALRELIRRQGEALSPQGRQALQLDLANAAARAVVLYPNDARLHAELAEAAAAIGRYDEAARQAREALRLDALNPHADRKLADDVRVRLRESLPRWTSPPPAS